MGRFVLTSPKTISVLTTVFVLTCVALSFCSKDDDDNLDRTPVQKDFSFKDFTGVKVGQAIVLKLIPSDTYKIQVTVPAFLERGLKVTKDGELLVIDLSGSRLSDDVFSAEVSLPVLNRLEASGVSQVTFASAFKTSESMLVKLSGASRLIDGAVDGENKGLVAQISGASQASMSGKVKSMDLKLSTASNFSGKDLTVSGKAVVNLSGASKSELTLNGDIEVKLSGASELIIYGSGKITTQDVTGASTLKKK